VGTWRTGVARGRRTVHGAGRISIVFFVFFVVVFFVFVFVFVFVFF
jgi:hypothetical protein